jgi:hypothetical protein
MKLAQYVVVFGTLFLRKSQLINKKGKSPISVGHLMSNCRRVSSYIYINNGRFSLARLTCRYQPISSLVLILASNASFFPTKSSRTSPFNPEVLVKFVQIVKKHRPEFRTDIGQKTLWQVNVCSVCYWKSRGWIGQSSISLGHLYHSYVIHCLTISGWRFNCEIFPLTIRPAPSPGGSPKKATMIFS